LAMLGLMTLLLLARYRLEAMRGDLEILRREAERHEESGQCLCSVPFAWGFSLFII